MNEREDGATVEELASLAGGRVVEGDASARIRRVSSIEGAREGDLIFVEDARLLEDAMRSRASCVVVPEGTEVPKGRCAIEAARPKLAFALMAERLHPRVVARATSVHETAVVARSAELGEGCHIGPHVTVGEGARVGARSQILAGAFVGENVTIGRESILHPRVVLYDGVTVGDRVVLHAGVVVGADGFGYVRDDAGEYRKFPQVGTVVIEDDVEVGASTCIDRAALGETRIGRGTKIDNLVQVGHNVTVGERVVIAAQTGISGSTVIESDAVIGGQVGMGDHARVERGAIIGSKAGILPGKVVRAGAVMWGVPVRPLEEYKRLNALWGRLPRMRDEIEELKRQVRELLARIDDGA